MNLADGRAYLRQITTFGASASQRPMVLRALACVETECRNIVYKISSAFSAGLCSPRSDVELAMRRATHKEKPIESFNGQDPIDSPATDAPVNAQAEAKAAATSKPPKPPIWEYLEDPERDLDNTSTWLYRVEPVLSRKEGEHAVAKIKGRLERDHILHSFGSGVYKVFVNDSRGKTRYSETVSFHNPSYPPRLDVRELATADPRNEVYIQMLTKAAEKPAKEIPADVTALLNTVVEKSGTFDPKLAMLWETATKRCDELSKQLVEKNASPDLLNLVRGIKELLPAPAPPPPAAPRWTFSAFSRRCVSSSRIRPICWAFSNKADAFRSAAVRNK
jgi:hypothetical protein